MKTEYALVGERCLAVKVTLSPKTVVKQGPRYVLYIPTWLGEKLHGKLIKVTVETLEVEEIQKKT